MLETFLLIFIPLFVAMDPLGITPIFASLTKTMKKKERDHVLNQSLVTAFAISMAFLFLGQKIFAFLGIQLYDFQIAGGLLLLIISILDLVHPTKEQRLPGTNIGVVPIGIPLIMGPAALTTLMMLGSQHGYKWVAIGLASNLVLMYFALHFSKKAESIFGVSGMKAASKIVSLFLAAIAIMFIRVGLQSAFS